MVRKCNRGDRNLFPIFSVYLNWPGPTMPPRTSPPFDWPNISSRCLDEGGGPCGPGLPPKGPSPIMASGFGGMGGKPGGGPFI